MWPLFSWLLWETTWSTTPFTLPSTLSSWVTQTSKTSIRCHQNHCDGLRQPDHNLLSLSWVEHRITILLLQNIQGIKYRNITEIFQRICSCIHKIEHSKDHWVHRCPNRFPKVIVDHQECSHSPRWSSSTGGSSAQWPRPPGDTITLQVLRGDHDDLDDTFVMMKWESVCLKGSN